jgi:Tol biopolymer transport system component/DNA-binding winged helix-turn-helix (wHTH) protein
LKEREVYQFGEFTLDPTAKVVFRGSQVLHLTRKAVETLLVLVENPGQVLTKEEIIEAVWGDRVVEEANLTQNIAVVRRALAAEAGTPAHIETFPGRGYRLEGPVITSPSPPHVLAAAPAAVAHAAGEEMTPPDAARRARGWFWTSAALFTVIVIGLAWWFWRRSAATAEGSFRVIAVTRVPGKEFQPAISPDGSRVAYLWANETSGAPGLWLKAVGENTQREVTKVVGHYSSPAWSPDGRSVACVRIGGSATEIVIASPDNGREQVVTRLTPPNYGWDYPLLDWSPDGQSLVVSHSSGPDHPLGLLVVSAATGSVRTLTTPGDDVVGGDVNPRFSPDGRLVSFIRLIHRTHQELYVVPFAGGSPRQWTAYGKQVSGQDWSRDGRSVILASDREGEFRLWRMPVAAGQPAGKLTPIAIYGEFPIQLTVARQAPRLAYSVLHQDRNIWRLDLASKVWKRLIASSGVDASPVFSPDGDSICFRSDRSGEEQLWVARADGSEPIQVTSGLLHPSVGRWSADGRAIVFNNPRTAEIFVARRTGERSWSVKSTGASGIHPVFSPDSEWIYAGGQTEITRIPVQGGTAKAMAATRSLSLDISPDGKSLYFVREPNDSVLWRLTLATGEIDKVLEGLVPACTSCWALAHGGIYYLGTDRNSLDRQILYFHDWRGAKDREILRYPEPLWPLGSGPFSLAPDQRFLLCVRMDPSAGDVMLVSPFE